MSLCNLKCPNCLQVGKSGTGTDFYLSKLFVGSIPIQDIDPSFTVVILGRCRPCDRLIPRLRNFIQYLQTRDFRSSWMLRGLSSLLVIGASGQSIGTPRNIPEEWRPQLRRGGSLQSRPYKHDLETRKTWGPGLQWPVAPHTHTHTRARAQRVLGTLTWISWYLRFHLTKYHQHISTWNFHPLTIFSDFLRPP